MIDDVNMRVSRVEMIAPCVTVSRFTTVIRDDPNPISVTSREVLGLRVRSRRT